MAINTTTSGPLRIGAIFASSGTFIPPAGTTRCFVSIVGASGGQGNQRRYRSAGQGGGGILTAGWVQVVPGQPHVVVVGAGGTGGAASNSVDIAGSAGGQSSFDASIFANGGNGTAGAHSSGQGAGSAGSASAETSLPTISASAASLARVTEFVSQTTGANAGGFNSMDRYSGNPAGGSGIAGKVYIFI